VTFGGELNGAIITSSYANDVETAEAWGVATKGKVGEVSKKSGVSVQR